MPAPTFVSDTETAWDSATVPKSVSMTTAVGDTVVFLGGIEDWGNIDTARTSMSPSGTLTWTEYEDKGGSSRGRVGAWGAPGVAASNWLLTGTHLNSTTFWWGFNALRFSDASGIGEAVSAEQAGVNATISITTQQANSAIAVITVDWSAINYPNDGTNGTRNWNSASAGNGTELSYFCHGSHYTVFVGYYPDAGAAGAKTVGCLVGSTQGGHSIAAIEILGGAAPPPDPPPAGDRSNGLPGRLPYQIGSTYTAAPPSWNKKQSSMLLTFS